MTVRGSLFCMDQGDAIPPPERLFFFLQDSRWAPSQSSLSLETDWRTDKEIASQRLTSSALSIVWSAAALQGSVGRGLARRNLPFPAPSLMPSTAPSLPRSPATFISVLDWGKAGPYFSRETYGHTRQCAFESLARLSPQQLLWMAVPFLRLGT